LLRVTYRSGVRRRRRGADHDDVIANRVGVAERTECDGGAYPVLAPALSGGTWGHTRETGRSCVCIGLDRVFA
ncbi:MAG: hypothetical protein KAI25_04650, partial [Hyphomicrobiaceae bacterium]|nr:hypothetical protein [Hyphomicrobiaceae bacterium]